MLPETGVSVTPDYLIGKGDPILGIGALLCTIAHLSPEARKLACQAITLSLTEMFKLRRLDSQRNLAEHFNTK